MSEPMNSLQVMEVKKKAFAYGNKAHELASQGDMLKLAEQAKELRRDLDLLPPEYRAVAQHLRNTIQILDAQLNIAAKKTAQKFAHNSKTGNGSGGQS